jgi:hypothetical protein
MRSNQGTAEVWPFELEAALGRHSQAKLAAQASNRADFGEKYASPQAVR